MSLSNKKVSTRIGGAPMSRIKATPAMIQAGVDELLSYSDEDLQYTDSDLVVRGIFDAMMQARGRPDPVPHYPHVSLGRSVGIVEAK